MWEKLKKNFKWSLVQGQESPKKQTLYMFAIMKGILEDILFWNNVWLSSSFILIANMLFFICVNKQISMIEFALCLYGIYLCIDSLEVWLKYKHRTGCLRRLSEHDCNKLNSAVSQTKCWLHTKWTEFLLIRDTNHTKAFLLMNMLLGIVLIIGKCVSGYLVSYLLCMFICVYHQISPTISRLLKNVRLNPDSDVEFEGLIPDVSEVDIKLLSIEPEPQNFDEKQILDYWKPDDLPVGETSDSSDNSSSLVSNLSIEKMPAHNRDIDTSDSSEDEYIPISQQNEHLKSTIEVIDSAPTWSSSAYNTFWNMTEIVSNMINTKSQDVITRRKRVESADSSDGFEMIENHDIPNVK